MNFKKITTVNYNRLTSWLLPIDWRQILFTKWVNLLVFPLKVLYQDFIKYRKKKLYRLSHNSQVCYMEAVLNDAYDPALRRIRIQNGLFLQPVYFYTPPEERPVYFGTQYFYDPQDLITEGADFIVCIPEDLKPSTIIALDSYLSDIKALVNSYKLASKTYYTKWIN